ncbi:MAG: M10 family metallopeptidase C-terminal domain-containing protein [Pseudomonadota bacterium]
MVDGGVGVGDTPGGDDADGGMGHADYCACDGCDGDGHSHNNGLNPGPLFFPDPTGDEAGLVGTDADNGKPVISAFQAAGLIARSGLTWAQDGDLNVTFSFASNATAGIGFEAFTEANKAFTRDVLALYTDVSGLTVTEVGPDEASDIIFKVESGTANGGGFFDGQNVVVGNVSFEPVAEPGTYLFNLLLHEVGHAFGLAHPGDYNGSGFNYADDAEFFSDSAQFTNMSYFSEANTGGDFGFLATLGIHDILAIQMEYGANMTTRSGNTVYGFGNNTGIESYDLSDDDGRGFSIWDAGGTDTLNFSGSSSGTELDLREGSFSSVNGDVANVSIAYGVTIENGIGSAGDDLIIGNGVANTLRGGAGDDEIIGGEDTAPVAVDNPRDFTGIQLNADPLTFDQHMVATGIDGIAGGAVTLEMLVHIDRTPSDNIVFASYAVPNTSNEFLVQGEVGGNLTVHIVGFRFNSTIPTASLVDGEPHRLSVTWNTDGLLNIYIDGQLAQQGFHRAGESFQSGGTLVIGQDQDSLGGRFQDSQIFQGTVGDIRIFNDVRSAAEISANAFTELTGNEAGLAHYWQAGSGNTLVDLAGSDDLSIVNGGTLNATADPAPSTAPDADTLFGEGGDDTLRGGWGNDRLVGGEGDDTLIGGAGNDTLEGDGEGTGTGGTYDDTLAGGGGDDLLIGGRGGDAITGGGGTDTVSFASSAAGVNADLLNGGTGGDAAGDTYASVEIVVGSAFNDTVSGTNAADEVRGNDGDDTLNGREGDDLLLGSNGNDTLNGGGGNDTLNGGAGIDSFSGGGGDDIINTGTGSDTAGGGDGDDTLNGQGGNDTLNGGDGDDIVNGAGGNDDVKGGQGDDIVRGGVGDDVLGGSDGDDQLFGQADDDTLNGGAGDDLINGASGVDTLNGGAGNDILNGGSQNDVLFGGTGNDQLRGQGGADRMEGGGGADTLNGAAGADLLFGQAGNDTLNGGAGNDTLFGGAGNDILNGQGGTDRYVFDAGDAGTNTVTGLAAGETVHLLGFGFASAGAAAGSLTQSGRDVVFANSGVTITFQNADLADVAGAISTAQPPQSSPELFDFSGIETGAGTGPAGGILAVEIDVPLGQGEAAGMLEPMDALAADGWDGFGFGPDDDGLAL